jgi:hypothetical protein
MKLAAVQLPAHACGDTFQESRMSGNLLVRFDEGRVGRTSVSPSLLLYREIIPRGPFAMSASRSVSRKAAKIAKKTRSESCGA